MTPEQLRVADRITAYLSGGGLFNPELANHDAVRDLLIDAREALHMLRLHIADKNATITAMGATHEKLAARVAELENECSAADIYGRTSASHGFINAPKWHELADETKILYRESAARSKP